MFRSFSVLNCFLCCVFQAGSVFASLRRCFHRQKKSLIYAKRNSRLRSNAEETRTRRRDPTRYRAFDVAELKLPDSVGKPSFFFLLPHIRVENRTLAKQYEDTLTQRRLTNCTYKLPPYIVE